MLALGGIAGNEMFASTAQRVNRGRIGIQLFSVRHDLPRDFEGTLKKLSDIGFSSVETYGFNGETFLDRNWKDVNNLVRGLGMRISGSHCSPGSGILPEDTNAPQWDTWKKIADKLREVGATWAVQPSPPAPITTLWEIKRLADHFNRCGQVCKERGVKFGFHNHPASLGRIERETILEFMINNTDPELVYFQLDIRHAINGGGNILHLLRTYPKRIPMWHASDYDSGIREYTNLGKGNVPYRLMFNLPDAGGLEDLTVEQELTGDIFALCKIDFDFLKLFSWTGV